MLGHSDIARLALSSSEPGSLRHLVSTQATINVLEAMATLTSRQDNGSNQSGNPVTAAPKAVVFVDGKQQFPSISRLPMFLSGPMMSTYQNWSRPANTI